MNTHIVCGSHRSPSQGIKISKFIASQIEKRGGRVSITDLSHNALPLWDEGMWKGDPKWAPIWKPIEAQVRAADSLIIVTPEYSGMAAPALKNFFLFCNGDLIGHKPALLVAVSAGQGGSYPIEELRGSSYKNSRVLYIPDHIIIKEAEKMLNDGEPTHPSDIFYRKKINHSLDVLELYENAMKSVRVSPALNYKEFGNGM